MSAKKTGQQTAVLASPPTILCAGNVVGRMEGEGPLAACFDYVDQDDTFGEATWEQSERAMQQKALALALQKGGLTAQQLDRRILRDVEENPNKNFSNLLAGLLPQKLIGTVCALSGVPATEKANQLTRAQRAALRDLLKCLPLTFAGFRPIAEAIITRGGVDVRQVQPGSMQIKERPGLYFVGEVLDVDGYTGGFNLQIAFSTAYLAARDILAKRGAGGL